MLFSAALLISATLAGLVPSALASPIEVAVAGAVAVAGRGGSTVQSTDVLAGAKVVIAKANGLKASLSAIAKANAGNPALGATTGHVQDVLNCLVPQQEGLLGGLLGNGLLSGVLGQCLAGQNVIGGLLGGAPLGAILANGAVAEILSALLGTGSQYPGHSGLDGLGLGDLLGGLLGVTDDLVYAVANLLNGLDLLNNGCGCGQDLIGDLLEAVVGLVDSVIGLLDLGEGCGCGHDTALMASVTGLLGTGI